ncbi:MAG: GAF domain-containing protein, partial [Synechococcaceae cyanobacterium SM2_3_1]|nr:GAF domain-containing protein [Synechococcaceae cyanobacterium SM2_3_1]
MVIDIAMILPLFPENDAHALLATLAEGVVLHQANGDIVFANDAATRILGLSRDELLGRSSLDPRWHTIHEDGSSFPGHQHPAMLTLHSEKSQRSVIMGVQLPDERLVWISINTQPLYQPQDHQLIGVIASFFDITELKQAEQQLLAQLERSHLLNQITQGIRESLDLPTVINTAVQEVRKLLATDRVVLYQFNPDWSGEFIAESVSASQWSCLHAVINDTCFSERYIQPYTLGRSRSISDIYESDLDPYHIQLLEQYQVRANVVVPVLQGSHLWGLLIADHCTGPKAWDHWAIELMTQIANQLGIATQQAQLHSQLQQTNAELHYQVEVRNAELRQMISYEQLLRVITDEVRASLNEEEILQAAVRELSLGLQLGNCTIGFLNPDQQTYVIKYEYALSLPAFEGSLGTVNPVVLPQLQKGETVYVSTAHPLYGWCTIVACSLKDDLELLGFLKLIRRPSRDSPRRNCGWRNRWPNQ